MTIIIPITVEILITIPDPGWFVDTHILKIPLIKLVLPRVFGGRGGGRGRRA